MAYGLVVNGALNLRALPDQSSKRLALIPDGTTLTVNPHNDQWLTATYGAREGYVMKAFVSILDAPTDNVIQGVVIGGRLNLRRAAMRSANAQAQIPDGTRLDVTDYDPSGAWYRVSYAGYAGYVMKEFVETQTTPPATSTPPATPLLPATWRYGRVTSDTLNVRKAPSRSAPLWNNVWPRGRVALVMPADSGWYQTTYRGEKAYVSSDYMEEMASPRVHDRLTDRMLYLVEPEIGRTQSVYYNGYSGEWCHRFVDWLAMHAGQPKSTIPNTSNCGVGIVWFVNDAKSGGFFFKDAVHKARMMNAYPAIEHLNPSLTPAEQAYVPSVGDYVYFRWSNAASRVNVSHVGIIRAVSSDAISTVEGNAGNSVAYRSYDLSDGRIVGYGKPRYEDAQ